MFFQHQLLVHGLSPLALSYFTWYSLVAAAVAVLVEKDLPQHFVLAVEVVAAAPAPACGYQQTVCRLQYRIQLVLAAQAAPRKLQIARTAMLVEQVARQFLAIFVLVVAPAVEAVPTFQTAAPLGLVLPPDSTQVRTED
jgi:hypothetical protein